jgi:hypothetical protein
VTPADRGNRTVLVRRAAEGAVPAGARTITVTLTGTHAPSAFVDAAYADRMGLFLTAPPPPPATADTTPPQTTIEKAPKNKGRSATAKYEFASSEPGSTFECAFDSKRFKPCQARAKFKRLDRGKHKLSVRATDPAGNTDPTPATDRFKRTR